VVRLEEYGCVVAVLILAEVLWEQSENKLHKEFCMKKSYDFIFIGLKLLIIYKRKNIENIRNF
jgi:hypothetical protein